MKKDRPPRPSRADAHASFLSSLLRSGEGLGWQEKPVPTESATSTKKAAATVLPQPVSGKPITAAG